MHSFDILHATLQCRVAIYNASTMITGYPNKITSPSKLLLLFKNGPECGTLHYCAKQVQPTGMTQAVI